MSSGTVLGVPIIGILVFWALFCGPAMGFRLGSEGFIGCIISI